MKIVCDACGAKYSIADEKVAGKVFKIRCKKCSNIIVVRGNANEAGGAAAAPDEEAQPNKDTKVFDYQGYDSPQDAMAAGEDGEWHVVIDQEQVGPMTSAEVRQRFAAGEVDSESYIWKEGFADWERIPDVPEFADLEAGAPAAAEPSAAAAANSMFGSVPSAAEAAGGDLFGAESSGRSGGDLFGEAAPAASNDLFGGGDSVGDNTGEIPMSKEAEAQLKGQRNENSVLFSLGNLAALASDSPKPAAASVSSSKPSVSNSGGSEGSGLIDIRSMASVYLADKDRAGPASTPSGSADDLPVFSQSAFESASPVLLPTASGGADKKLLYTLVGVIAALVVAAAVLVIVVLKGDDSKEPAVAANNVTDGVGSASDTDPGDTAPDNAETPTAEGGDPAGATEGETAENGGDEAEAAAAAATNLTAEASGSDESESRDKPKDKGRDKPRDKSSDKPRDKPRDRAPKEPSPAKEPSGGAGCDEVTCLVDPGKACCRKFNKSSGGDSGKSSSSNSNLPEKLSRGDITSGIGAVRGRVTSCGDKHGGSGTVKVKIKIGGDGKVKSADASGGGSSLRSCVTSAVKRAKFKKTQKGMSVTYPFVFR